MNKITIAIFAVLPLFVSGCRLAGIKGNGDVTTDQRAITEVSEIDASGAFEIEWRSGPPALTITTDKNLLPHIQHKISGDTLRLRTREQLRPTDGIKVLVSSATLKGADIRGAVRFTAKQLSGPKFYFQSHGAAKITLDGTVDELLGDMTGATKLMAEGLKTKTAELSATGAAKADIFVSETLKVSLTGAGKVTYSGNPKTVEPHITGAGSVRAKD